MVSLPPTVPSPHAHHPLVLVLPQHPPRSLKAQANPVIFDEMAGFLEPAPKLDRADSKVKRNTLIVNERGLNASGC